MLFPFLAIPVDLSVVGASWVQYRAGTGRRAPEQRLSLGRYGQLTVEQARRLARQALADVAHGADPATDREKAKAALTLAALGPEASIDD